MQMYLLTSLNLNTASKPHQAYQANIKTNRWCICIILVLAVVTLIRMLLVRSRPEISYKTKKMEGATVLLIIGLFFSLGLYSLNEIETYWMVNLLNTLTGFITIGIAILAHSIRTLHRFDHAPTEVDNSEGRKSARKTTCLIIAYCTMWGIHFGFA
jgi:fumarate reductase subunit D